MANGFYLSENMIEGLKQLPPEKVMQAIEAMDEYRETGIRPTDPILKLFITLVTPALQTRKRGGQPGNKNNATGKNQHTKTANNQSVVDESGRMDESGRIEDEEDDLLNTTTTTTTTTTTSIPPKPPRVVESKFAPPSLQEVLDFAKQQNDMAGCGGFRCSKQMAEEFWGNYAANGWVVGNESKTPIRDWKAKLRQWCARNSSRSADDIPNGPVSYEERAKQRGSTC